jgi:predicted NBD/HSP70 family sugar kinase
VDTTPDAPLCNCGKRGCLEAIASDYGIVRAVSGRDPGHSVEDAISVMVDQAWAGDTSVQTIFARAGTVLGIAIANLINIFDPALVLLGGEGMRAGELILEPLRKTIPQHVFGRSNADIALDTLQTNEVNWARGAASLVLHEVFSPPIYQSEKRPLIDDLLAANGNRR